MICSGPAPRGSASSETTTSASARRGSAVTGRSKAIVAPSRAARSSRGSWACHPSRGNLWRSASSCRINVGEPTGPVRRRSPSPCVAASSSRRGCRASRNAAQLLISPRPPHRLRAIRIIQRENRRLCERICRAEARRMHRVAFDLDRAPFDRRARRLRVRSRRDRAWSQIAAGRRGPFVPAFARRGRSLLAAWSNPRPTAPSARREARAPSGETTPLWRSSVAHRTIGQIVDMDMIFHHQTFAALVLIGGRPPIGCENLGELAQVRGGIAMAVEAPLHRQRRGLSHQRHALDFAVTGRAADALCDVDAMIEIDVSRAACSPGANGSVRRMRGSGGLARASPRWSISANDSSCRFQLEERRRPARSPLRCGKIDSRSRARPHDVHG